MKVIKCRLKAAGGVLQGGGVVYAKVIDAGRIDAESLVDMMAANCGVSRSQVLAVLDALAGVVGDMLTLGHSVEVPGLGFLAPKVNGRVVVNSNGKQVVDNARSEVTFKPKEALSELFGDVCYEIASPRVCDNVTLTQEEAVGVARSLLAERCLFSVTDFADRVMCSESYARSILYGLAEQGLIDRVRTGGMSVFCQYRE